MIEAWINWRRIYYSDDETPWACLFGAAWFAMVITLIVLSVLRLLIYG